MPRSVLSERVQSLRLPDSVHRRGFGGGRLPWTLCTLLGLSTALLGHRILTRPVPVSLVASSATKIPLRGQSADSADTSASPKLARRSAGDKESKIALESKGYIIAAHQILISPTVSGRVMKLTIEEGKRVAKGDILAEIEDIDYRTDFERAVSTLENLRQQLLELEHGNRPEEVAQARAQLQEVEVQYETLDSDWRRMQELRKKNVASIQDYDQTRSRFLAMRRQVERLRFALTLMELGPRKERIDAARAQVHDAEANVEKSRWKLDNCKIRAPISGTILKKNAEEGNLVNAVAFSGSVSLCEMADLSDLEVDLTVQERDIAKVFKGQKCKVRAEAFSNRLYDGVVSRLMPIADRSKGAIPVRVKLSIPHQEEGVYLKPEMGAIVTFYGEAEPTSPKLSEATTPHSDT
jgi:multidrug resistance efflux pump